MLQVQIRSDQWNLPVSADVKYQYLEARGVVNQLYIEVRAVQITLRAHLHLLFALKMGAL